jgi:PST family polysaccharide transporter
MLGAVKSLLVTYAAFSARLLLPLVLLPLLSHRLGAEAFGVALAVQSLSLFGAVLAEYGFHVSGARDVGLQQTKAAIGEVGGRIVSAQIVTAALAGGLVGLAGLLTPSFGGSGITVVSAIIIAITTGCNPAWYFRGIGRPATGIMIESLGQLATILLSVLLVHSNGDVHLAVVAMAFGSTLTAAVSFLYVAVATPLTNWLDMRTAWGSIAGASMVFLSRAGSSTYTVASVWLMGTMAPPEQVAYYGVAAKIASVAEAAFQPAVHLALPPLVRAASGAGGYSAARLSLYFGAAFMAAGMASVLIVWVSAAPVVAALFSGDLAPAAEVLRLLAWLGLLVACRAILGSLLLVAFRRDRTLAVAVGAGGLVFLGLIWVLVPSDGAAGMAIARLSCEVAVVVVMGLGVSQIVRDKAIKK